MNQDQYTLGNLFDKTACISKEMLLQYVKGQLSKPMLRRVEMHLIDCSLCADALEGIELAGPAAFEQMLKNVSDRIQTHQQAANEETDNVIEFRPQVNPPVANVRNPRRFMPMFGIAASIVLLAIVAIMFMGGDSASSIADNHFVTAPDGKARGGEEADATAFDKADELFLAKDYAAAVVLYDQINVPAAIFQAGTCYYRLGKYDLAVARFQTVIDKKQSWVEYAEINLAMSYLKLDKIADAKLVLERIVADVDHNFHKQATETLAEVQNL